MVGRTDPSNSDNQNGDGGGLVYVCVCACVMCLQYNILILDKTCLYTSSGSLFVRDALTQSGGCPYVPLLFGVDTDLRYYVIRDVIVI